MRYGQWRHKHKEELLPEYGKMPGWITMWLVIATFTILIVFLEIQK